MAPSQIKPNQGGLLPRGNANIAPSQIKPNIDLFLQGFFWLILKSVTALEELTHAKHQKPQNRGGMAICPSIYLSIYLSFIHSFLSISRSLSLSFYRLILDTIYQKKSCNLCTSLWLLFEGDHIDYCQPFS